MGGEREGKWIDSISTKFFLHSFSRLVCVDTVLSVSTERLTYYYYEALSTLLRRLLNTPAVRHFILPVWTPCESSLRISFRIVLALSLRLSSYTRRLVLIVNKELFLST